MIIALTDGSNALTDQFGRILTFDDGQGTPPAPTLDNGYPVPKPSNAAYSQGPVHGGQRGWGDDFL